MWVEWVRGGKGSPPLPPNLKYPVMQYVCFDENAAADISQEHLAAQRSLDPSPADRQRLACIRILSTQQNQLPNMSASLPLALPLSRGSANT